LRTKERGHALLPYLEVIEFSVQTQSPGFAVETFEWFEVGKEGMPPLFASLIALSLTRAG
jgi:hypothetical protein